MRLQDKVAIVTDGASGIGKEVAIRIVAEEVEDVLPTFNAFHPLGRNGQAPDARRSTSVSRLRPALSPASSLLSKAASWLGGRNRLHTT
jgi:hypothetical protein